ncbi:hypothetical protein DPMN_056896 [Dreissena polymorpha]|uniref:Uncharacterized protein n=1 Tax=Dreissena polymorpha TaxID=45954 RepID=A0A9D4CUK3_DREPO|nr:hypothetical protein DPMN_056896 [Dreissena polymorpha]
MKEEISSAIKRLNNGNSALPDSIPAVALKADIETIVELLYLLFSKKKFQQGGQRNTSSSSPRKATSVPAPTTKESHHCPSQKSFLIASCQTK